MSKGKHFDGEDAQRSSSFGVDFCPRWRDLIAAVAVVLGAAALFIFDLPLEDTEYGKDLTYLLTYWGTAIVSCVLCLFEFRLPYGAQRSIGWLLLFLMPLAAFFAVDLINSTRILTFTINKLFANYICYLMVYALIYAISRRVWVTALCGGIIFLVFGIANYFVVQFRGDPILPWDISSISTALMVTSGYKFDFTRAMMLSIVSFIFVLVLCVKFAPHGKAGGTKRARIIERAASAVISIALFILIFPVDILTTFGISVWAWNQKTSSEITGITAGFFANVQFLMVDVPEDYSPERVEELYTEIENMEAPEPWGEPDGTPTVIAVMNESFTDMQSAGDMNFTPDHIPYFRSLCESGEVIYGTAYSSVYGGNTCNSEYEFLTANTTAFLPVGSKPYQQYVDEPQTALTSIFDSYGYDCVAIHPGNLTAWERDLAYPLLGFDEFIYNKAFDIEREFIHQLTSDRSCYEQVIYEYENRGDEPLFIFNVTIQNHGGFEDETVKTTVQIDGIEGKYPDTEQYLSLVKESDNDLKYLIDYFSAQEDPVVILFFGDHWPSLKESFISELLGAGYPEDISTLMKKYEVPFFIWANYPIEAQEIESVSLNYLSGMLLRTAGMEGTAYTKFVENLRETIPVITAVGTIDKDGNVYEVGAETPYDELLNDYAVLQYNNAFGGEEKSEKVFTRTK